MLAVLVVRLGPTLSGRNGWLGQAQESIAATTRTLDQQVERLNGHFSTLLEFSQPLELHVQARALADMLDEVLRSSPPPAGVRVRQHCDPSTTVVADRGQLVSALRKIVDNAYDAMPGGGELTLEADLRDGWVEIRIGDTGAGITPEDMQRIFEPLFSTKIFGLGMGLPTARSIIAAHGGRIAVQSTPGSGTDVLVQLPGGPGEAADGG